MLWAFFPGDVYWVLTDKVVMSLSLSPGYHNLIAQLPEPVRHSYCIHNGFSLTLMDLTGPTYFKASSCVADMWDMTKSFEKKQKSIFRYFWHSHIVTLYWSLPVTNWTTRFCLGSTNTLFLHNTWHTQNISSNLDWSQSFFLLELKTIVTVSQVPGQNDWRQQSLWASVIGVWCRFLSESSLEGQN